MDIGMRGMGGEKCLQEIIKLDPDAKVLIASGYAGEGLIKDTTLLGAIGFIVNPYTMETIAQTIANVLSE